MVVHHDLSGKLIKQKGEETLLFVYIDSMTSFILSSLFLILGSYFKGKMDIILFSKRKYAEWKNKWKLTESGKLIRYNEKDWYYFGNYPRFKEKFPFSSTILVCFTDTWHKYQFLFLRCIYMSIAIPMAGFGKSILLAFFVFPFFYEIGFYFSCEKYKNI